MYRIVFAKREESIISGNRRLSAVYIYKHITGTGEDSVYVMGERVEIVPHKDRLGAYMSYLQRLKYTYILVSIWVEFGMDVSGAVHPVPDKSNPSLTKTHVRLNEN